MQAEQAGPPPPFLPLYSKEAPNILGNFRGIQKWTKTRPFQLAHNHYPISEHHVPEMANTLVGGTLHSQLKSPMFNPWCWHRQCIVLCLGGGARIGVSARLNFVIVLSSSGGGGGATPPPPYYIHPCGTLSFRRSGLMVHHLEDTCTVCAAGHTPVQSGSQTRGRIIVPFHGSISPVRRDAGWDCSYGMCEPLFNILTCIVELPCSVVL